MKLDILTTLLATIAIAISLVILLHGNDNDEDYGPF
jgi:hypothetical protein